LPLVAGFQQHLDDTHQEVIIREQNDAPVVNNLPEVIVVPSADDLSVPDEPLPDEFVVAPDRPLPNLVPSADDFVLPDESEGLVPIFSSTVLSSSLMDLQLESEARANGKMTQNGSHCYSWVVNFYYNI